MPVAESNRVDLRFSQETVWNETPATPTMASVPYTSESIKYDKRTVQSQLVRADRLIDDIIEVGAGSAGDLNFEYKFGDFDKLIEGALGMDFVTMTFTGTANLSFAASGGGVQVLTGPAATFTNYVDGTHVRVSGANAQNNGVYRITAHSSTTLTITNATGTVQANSSATVLVKYARTGTNKKSFLFEKSFADIARFISFRGMRVGNWSMDVSSEQVITGTFGLMGAGAFSAGTTISGSVTPAGALSVASATANVGRIEENLVALATKIKGVKFNVNANPRALSAVASKFPIAINYGSFDITGTIDAYFEDAALYDKFLASTDSSLIFEIISPEDDRTIFTFPAIEFLSASPVGAGLNQDAMVSIEFAAKRSAAFASQMQVDLLT